MLDRKSDSSKILNLASLAASKQNEQKTPVDSEV